MNQMRKELCFRLELPNGLGIYQGGPIPPMAAETSHPSPYGDDKLRDKWKKLVRCHDNINYYFGFSSMEQLKRWFWCADYCRKAQEEGIRICIYQTNDYFIGDTQMIFRKSTSTLIGKADLI